MPLDGATAPLKGDRVDFASPWPLLGLLLRLCSALAFFYVAVRADRLHGSGKCFMAGSSRSQWPGENLLRSERDGSLPRPCCGPFRLHHPPRNKARHEKDRLGIGWVGYACGWISFGKNHAWPGPPQSGTLSQLPLPGMNPVRRRLRFFCLQLQYP